MALSVAGAARGLGVAPGTLRSWERRYGLAPSLHTPGVTAATARSTWRDSG